MNDQQTLSLTRNCLPCQKSKDNFKYRRSAVLTALKLCLCLCLRRPIGTLYLYLRTLAVPNALHVTREDKVRQAAALCPRVEGRFQENSRTPLEMTEVIWLVRFTKISQESCPVVEMTEVMVGSPLQSFTNISQESCPAVWLPAVLLCIRFKLLMYTETT